MCSLWMRVGSHKELYMNYARPPFFFLLTTLKPPHSGWVGFGWAFTTSAIDTGLLVAFPLTLVFGREATSALRLLMNSAEKRLPSRVVL